MPIPDLFIVGAPKCGTSALYTYLRSHRQIFMSGWKEPHFFGADIRQPDSASKEEYCELFRNAQPGQCVGEASPCYLFSKTAAAEIKNYSPQARVIAILRNPIEMMHSLHSQCVYAGVEPILNFEQALAVEDERAARLQKRQTAHQQWNRRNSLLLYRSMADFRPQLERYFKVFGRSQVHVVLYDDLAARASQTLAAICAFLGVEEFPKQEFGVINANKRPRIAALAQVVGSHSGLIRSVVRTALPARALRKYVKARVLSWNTVYQPREKISPDLLKSLSEGLHSKVEQLGDFIGRDLSSWNSYRQLPADAA